MASFYEDASLVVIPSGYKTSKIYAEKPTDGSGDLTFTRASGATRVASNGLIEKVRTNLALQSNTFSTTWSNVGSSEVSGQAGYDGTNNAWSLVEDSSTGLHTLIQIPSTFGLVTLSIYAKAGTRNWVFLRGVQGASNVRAWFNLSTGTIGTVEANGTAKIESVGNGWYRCSLTVANFESGFEVYVAISSADTIESYTGNGTGNILIQNFQYETGDIATAYIPTTTAAVSVGPVSNVPRLDYLGSSCPRLLLEPQRTNLVFFSEQLNNAGWAGSAVVTANTAVSPDGSTNADSVMESATTDFQIIGDPVTTVSGTAYTYSFFAKPNGRNFARILFGNGSFPDDQSAYFNLLTGATSASASVTASMVSYGNGWWRCIATCTSDANATDAVYLGPARNITDGYATYPGNASLGIYAYGVQQEAGAYATSYIPTLAASVTRVQDFANKAGIGSLLPSQTGTIYVEFDWQRTPNDVQVMSVHNNSTGLAWIAKQSSTEVQGTYFASGYIGNISGTISASSGMVKVAYAWTNGSQALYVNGVQIGTATDAISDSNDLSILELNGFWGITKGGSAIAQALVFNSRLTNAQLAELTTL